MRRAIFGCVFLLTLGGAGASSPEVVRATCSRQAPSGVGQVTLFTGIVGERTRDALHVDFDGFGADFGSLELRLESPAEWNGLNVPVYFQQARVGDRDVRPGQVLAFRANVPACLDQPWLFLDAIEPKLTEGAHGAGTSASGR